MGERSHQASLGNRKRIAAHTAATAEFGCHRGDSHVERRRDERASRLGPPHDRGDGRAEGQQEIEHACRERRIRRQAAEGAGQIIKRAAAAVKIHEEIRLRQQQSGDPFRNLARRSAGGVAGKKTREISVIDRRRSAAGQRGGRVGARHDDDPPPDRRGIEIAGEGAEDNLPLILIPVHAAGEECGRALAVADHSDWNDDLAIGGAVVGPRKTHRAQLRPARSRSISSRAGPVRGAITQHSPS